MNEVHESATSTPLHAARSGAGSPLVLVHGFTQTGECWGPLRGALEAEFDVRRVDLPGHGGSPPPRGGLDEAANDLAAAGGPAIYIGYSMGARVLMHLMIADPRSVVGAVLVGGHPGLTSARARADRKKADERWARRFETEALEAVLEAWMGQPVLAGLPEPATCLDARLVNLGSGLAGALRALGTGRQRPLESELRRSHVPSLWVAGERDGKFSELNRRVVADSTSMRAVRVPDAGHTAHLENPAGFLEVVVPWLRSLSSRGAP